MKKRREKHAHHEVRQPIREFISEHKGKRSSWIEVTWRPSVMVEAIPLSSPLPVRPYATTADIETDAAPVARVSAKSKPPQDMPGNCHQWSGNRVLPRKEKAMNTTLQRASEITSEFSHGNWDGMFAASSLEFEDFDHISEKATGNVYRMMDSAKRLISQRLRLPADYLGRCPRDLQAENMNYWLSNLGDAPLFCRFKGQDVRAFFTRRYKPIDNTQVMERVLDSFAPHTRVEFKISNEMMLLNIPDHSLAFKVSNDRMVPGCHFSNSEVGLVAYSCSVFYQRLICTNGLIHADTIATKTRHIKRNALDDFHATMEEVRRLAMAQEGKMRLSIESKVDDPKASINSFGKRFGHTTQEIQKAQNAWDTAPGYTLWAVIQAFTYAAKANHLSVEQAYRFQRTGGNILSLAK